MKRLFFILIMAVLLSACQNANIKNRLGGNINGDGADGETAVGETTIQELEIDDSDLAGLEVKEGTIVAGNTREDEGEDVSVTINYDQDDEYEADETAAEIPKNAAVMKRVSGYRIQLITVTKKENAEEFGKKFEETLAEASRDKENEDAYYYKDNVPVYIEFYEPYWKLRVGNYTNRVLAEKELEFIKKLGYDDAWVVRTVILVKE